MATKTKQPDWAAAMKFLCGPDGLGTQAAVARELGISQQKVSTYATGETKRMEWTLGDRIIDLGERLIAKAAKK
jgi:predicted transcriptional regulator